MTEIEYLRQLLHEISLDWQITQQQLFDSQKQVTLLRGLVEQSRGSVKFDLNRYEQLLTIKQKVSVEKSAQYISMDIEANRLSKTLDGIDEALAATADLDDLILCHAEPVGIGSKARGIGEDYQPLYRAWEPKP